MMIQSHGMKNQQTNPNVLSLGDFNFPSIEWATLTVKPDPAHSTHSTKESITP